MKKPILICITFCLLFSQIACDKTKAQKTYRTASEQSAKILTYGEGLLQANLDAVNAGKISPETLSKLNNVTNPFVTAITAYEKALDEAEKLIKANDGKIPAGLLDNLSDKFQFVIDAFLAVTKEFNLLGKHSETVATILTSIRLAILAIQGAFSDARDLMENKNYATA